MEGLVITSLIIGVACVVFLIIFLISGGYWKK